MSAPLKLLTANVSRIFINNRGTVATGVNLLGALSNNLQSQTVRWKKKGGKGSTRNPMKHSKSSHRGVKKYPGEYVEKGMILHTQLGLRIYPGENVGCGKDCTLFALEAGRVVVTTEMLSPHPESPLYPYVKAGKVVYKQFYHILPEEQKQEFRLISQT